MDWSEAATGIAAAIAIAALFLFPKWFSFRHRAIAGAVLFVIGWVGIFTGLALGNEQFMQSMVVAWLWMGSSSLAIVTAITLLVPVFFEWRRKRRRAKGRIGKWPAGH